MAHVSYGSRGTRPLRTTSVLRKAAGECVHKDYLGGVITFMDTFNTGFPEIPEGLFVSNLHSVLQSRGQL